MKTVFRTVPLWLVLVGMNVLLWVAGNDGLVHPLAGCALTLLPALAVWLTAWAAAGLPENRLGRIVFWVGTLAGWATLLLAMQGRAGMNATERPLIAMAAGIAGVVVVWLGIKARRLPSWRLLGELAGALVIVALLGGVFAWGYEARTRAVAARAEARWAEIGMPMSEFEKALTPSRENAGSQIMRQVLREQANSLFYKVGTRASRMEPALESSPATDTLIKQAVEVISKEVPPSDDLDLSSQSMTALESAGAALDESYRRMLAAESATWASNPNDGYELDVPNFLGIRHLAQVITADSMRRLAAGDEEGAARALSAGLRMRKGLTENPSLVSLMISVAIDGLFSLKEVRLPADEEGLKSIAQDAATLRAEFERRIQMEAWLALRQSRIPYAGLEVPAHLSNPLPDFADRIVNSLWLHRQCAVAALNGAEHMAIEKSPSTVTSPDLGTDLHNAVCEAHPSAFDPNFCRAIMRIHATLLLREQMELIRDTRARLASGRPVEAHDSVVLPGLRWDLRVDAEKKTVSTRLVGAPQWIVEKWVAPNEFWILPLDGSVAWQFHRDAKVTSRE